MESSEVTQTSNSGSDAGEPFPTTTLKIEPMSYISRNNSYDSSVSSKSNTNSQRSCKSGLSILLAAAADSAIATGSYHHGPPSRSNSLGSYSSGPTSTRSANSRTGRRDYGLEPDVCNTNSGMYSSASLSPCGGINSGTSSIAIAAATGTTPAATTGGVAYSSFFVSGSGGSIKGPAVSLGSPSLSLNAHETALRILRSASFDSDVDYEEESAWNTGIATAAQQTGGDSNSNSSSKNMYNPTSGGTRNDYFYSEAPAEFKVSKRHLYDTSRLSDSYDRHAGCSGEDEEGEETGVHTYDDALDNCLDSYKASSRSRSSANTNSGPGGSSYDDEDDGEFDEAFNDFGMGSDSMDGSSVEGGDASSGPARKQTHVLTCLELVEYLMEHEMVFDWDALSPDGSGRHDEGGGGGGASGTKHRKSLLSIKHLAHDIDHILKGASKVVETSTKSIFDTMRHSSKHPSGKGDSTHHHHQLHSQIEDNQQLHNQHHQMVHTTTVAAVEFIPLTALQKNLQSAKASLPKKYLKKYLKSQSPDKKGGKATTPKKGPAAGLTLKSSSMSPEVATESPEEILLAEMRDVIKMRLCVFPAEEDGEAMDDLPEFPAATNILESGNLHILIRSW
jgi:hypothetical protein